MFQKKTILIKKTYQSKLKNNINEISTKYTIVLQEVN